MSWSKEDTCYRLAVGLGTLWALSVLVWLVCTAETAPLEVKVVGPTPEHQEFMEEAKRIEKRLDEIEEMLRD